MPKMRANEFVTESEKSLTPPTINVGDEVRVGKYKNKRAEVKGFTKDENNQPVLKTNKGDQKLFKPRIAKLMNPVAESTSGKINTDIADTLPAAFKLPGFPNQDAYMQYRFGVAVAAAKHNKAEGGPNEFDPESAFGRDQTVVCYTEDDEEAMNAALALMARGGAVALSTNKSQEPAGIKKASPVKAFKGYPR